MRASLEALGDMGDSQLETSLLRSCLALPKVSFVLHTCPPPHICHTTVDFNSAIHESLESIVGGPLSDWSWLKASLPSSRGGLNLRSASVHATAAFLASSSGSQLLVEQILGHPPGPPPHIRSALSPLASAAVHPDWQSLDDIDVPLHQHSLPQYRRRFFPAPALLSPLHPLPNFGPFIQSASHWGLAQCGAFSLPI